MPHLRSGKVVTGSEVRSANWMVASPGPLGLGTGCESGKKLVVDQSHHLARERQPDQPLSSHLQPTTLPSVSSEQFAPLVPLQKEQDESGQKLPGDKSNGIQCRRAARSKEGVALPISGTVVCEDWQATIMSAVTCGEETVRRGAGQGQQLFCSGTTLQNNLSAGTERQEHTSGVNISGFQESSGISGKKGKYSFMEVKSQIPSLEGEIESTERHDISYMPESEVLQPRKGMCNTEVKSTDIMILKMQIPDRKMNLGTQELLPEAKPQEENMPEKLDECFLIGSEKPGTQEKGHRCLSKKEGKWEAIEQNSTTQAVKKFKTNGNGSEDSKEREPHYSKSPTVATLAGTRSKSFLCHPVRKKSGVQYKKRKRRADQIECLQSFSVTPAEKERHVSAECDAERCKDALNDCNGLLCATEKNPFVRLEACNYINTLVKSSASGTTSSYKLSGFFHVAQNKRQYVFPHGTVEQCDTNCSTSRMQNEQSLMKGGLLFNKKEKAQNGEECFSSCQSENNICLRGKKWNIGRKPRKNIKIAEKSAGQNLFADVGNEHSVCELQTELAVDTPRSFAALGLNHREVTLPTSCDHTSALHTGKSTHEAQNLSAWRNSSAELLAFEDGCKNTLEFSVVAKGANSNSVAHCSATSGSPGVLAKVRDVSNCRKSKTGEKLNKVNVKLQQFACRRTVPMTGKKVWPVESCARTSEWFPKNEMAITQGKRLSRAAFEESSDESSVKAVGNSAVTGNLMQMNLCMSSAEINKESIHKIMGPNTECLTSLETPESSSVDIYETLRMSDENVESPVNMDRCAMAFSHDDVQELKVTLNFTTQEKDKCKGAVTKRSVTVQNGTYTGKKSRINFSRRVSVVNQTFSDLKLMKVSNTGNMKEFKIPLCRNKPESRKLELVHSFERKTCTPVELDSSSVSRRQKTGEETSLVNSEQQPLSVVSDDTFTASEKKKVVESNSKDLKPDSPENLSNEVSVLPEHFSSYPHPVLDGQLESSVLDIHGTQCEIKSNFPDCSWNAVDHPVALERNDDCKSRGDLSQHKSQNFPDILEAYKEDVLVIDVIQDDPDLFATSTEEELALTDCENCPVKASCTSICIKDEKQDIKPECPVISENRDSVNDNFRRLKIQESAVSNNTGNSCDWMLKDIKTHHSSRGSSPLEGVTEDFLEDGQLRELDELLKSYDVDEKFRFGDGVPDVKQEKMAEAEKSDCKYKDLVNCGLLSGLPLHPPKANVLSEATVMKPRTNDYRFLGKSPLMPMQNYGGFESWKMEKNAIASQSVQQILDTIELPRKYCRFYFMTLRGCERAKCWFWHVPEQGDEKICMAILRTYISVKDSGLLKRAVQIFVKYYREVTPGVDFASQVLNDLLISLLENCLLREVFQILNVTVQINTLPAVNVLLKVFEHVASLNITDAVPALIDTFRKLTDAGMFLEFEHFDHIIKFLHQLQVSSKEINIVLNIKSRFHERHFEKNWLFDFNLAVAEIQHCKEKSDWPKLGALYVNARTGCEHFSDLQKLSLCIAEILTRDSESDKPRVPFCDFADAVMKNLQHNEEDRIFIGRIGISVMYSYHKVQQWMKGRKVLDKLHEMQIHFTVLKGLIGAERLASRCQIVNKAAEIFLKTGSLDGAIWVLRESEWTTNTPLWPCDKVDILSRHNLLCTLVDKYLEMSLYRQAFEVLQKLPGFLHHSDTVDVSQYSCLFNKLINACFESKNLGVSSSAVDFMLSRNIAVDIFLLRGLITALGRSSLWSKARTYYKSALSLGCYPPLQGNLYHKILTIPSSLSEVEMLLAIEIFLVSNASDIQSPMAISQTLQIILKRCEDQTVQSNIDYQAAVERLILATRVSDPKLFLKHMTMNVNMEEVYILELASALKWLQENMKWAGKVWLFQ